MNSFTVIKVSENMVLYFNATFFAQSYCESAEKHTSQCKRPDDIFINCILQDAAFNSSSLFRQCVLIKLITLELL